MCTVDLFNGALNTPFSLAPAHTRLRFEKLSDLTELTQTHRSVKLSATHKYCRDGRVAIKSLPQSPAHTS